MGRRSNRDEVVKSGRTQQPFDLERLQQEFGGAVEPPVRLVDPTPVRSRLAEQSATEVRDKRLYRPPAHIPRYAIGRAVVGNSLDLLWAELGNFNDRRDLTIVKRRQTPCVSYVDQTMFEHERSRRRAAEAPDHDDLWSDDPHNLIGTVYSSAVPAAAASLAASRTITREDGIPLGGRFKKRARAKTACYWQLHLAIPVDDAMRAEYIDTREMIGSHWLLGKLGNEPDEFSTLHIKLGIVKATRDEDRFNAMMRSLEPLTTSVELGKLAVHPSE